MTSYEIRIVRKSDNSQIVVTANLLGDHAAFRRAQMLAMSGDFLEIWRGMTCVYSTVPERIAVH